MRVPRVVINTDSIISWQRGTLVSISSNNFHHLAHVLRLPKGSRIELVSSQPGQTAYYAIIESIGESKLLARLEIPAPIAICPKVALLCGMPKSSICDFIVEKTVELGLSRLIFFAAQRTQGRLTFEEQKKRLNRFNRIRDAALKQSGAQEYPTIIHIFGDLQEALMTCHGIDPTAEDLPRHQLRLALVAPQIAIETSQPPGIINFLTQLIPSISAVNHLEPQGNNAEIYIIVGPEGGLTEKELEISQSYSYQPASLGQKTLRTETAVVGVLSLINAVF